MHKSRAADAAGVADGWNRGMDSYDTWVLLAAPLTGLALVCLTALASLMA